MPTLNVENRTLFQGDNLGFLRGINSGTINLITTDPPFNKGKEYFGIQNKASKDAKFKDLWSWSDDVSEDWIYEIQHDYPQVWQVISAANSIHGASTGAFLCWLGIRLIEMHRLLAEDGSLYIHIDYTSHAWLKCMLDAIFGASNFRNEIAWCYTGPSSPSRYFPRKHDTILWYTFGDKWVFNRDEVRVPYKWKIALHSGRSTIFKNGHNRQRLKELSVIGKVVEDYWTDIPSIANLKEGIGYPTQKPIALFERIIKASSNRGDVVLDPFCGSGTSLVAAESLGREWIGIDKYDRIHEIISARIPDVYLQSQCTDYPIRTDSEAMVSAT